MHSTTATGTTATFSPERFQVRTPPVVHQINNTNKLGWRTGENPPVESKRVSSGLANSQDLFAAGLEMSAADWIAIVEAARRIFGRSAAAALWRQSPLPRIDQLPLLEARFLEEVVVQLTYRSAAAAELHSAYVEWSRENGCEPLSAGGFGRAMTRFGLERRKSGCGIYQHIALRRRWSA